MKKASEGENHHHTKSIGDKSHEESSDQTFLGFDRRMYSDELRETAE